MNKVKLLLAVLTISLSLSSTALSADVKEGSLAFAKCEEYINVRSEANIESDVVALLYDDCSATILNETDDGWFEIKSGNIVGFVSSVYMVTGLEAIEIADETGYTVASIIPEALNVRELPDDNSDIIDVIYENEEIEVVANDGIWATIALSTDYFGFVKSEYCKFKTYYPTAISIEELYDMYYEEVTYDTQYFDYSYTDIPTYVPETEPELNQVETESEVVQGNTVVETEPEYETQPEIEIKLVEPETELIEMEPELSETISDKPAQSCIPYDYCNEEYENTDNNYLQDSSFTSGENGQYIADYALQFVGNPYVYGGTSLTDGADCSGFIQSIYSEYGIDINRIASDQAAGGTSVGLDNIQAGDLLFYSDGESINHVALYIGDGMIVHAANESQGIIISDAFYDTPVSATRYW